MLHVVVVARHVSPPEVDVAVYDVTGDPPVALGAVQLSLTDVPVTEVVTAVGAAGGPRGVADLDAGDATDFPTALSATTEKV